MIFSFYYKWKASLIFYEKKPYCFIFSRFQGCFRALSKRFKYYQRETSQAREDENYFELLIQFLQVLNQILK